MRVFDILPTGAAHAISRRELSTLTGIEDRQLRRQIAKERRAGALILSSSEINVCALYAVTLQRDFSRNPYGRGGNRSGAGDRRVMGCARA